MRPCRCPCLQWPDLGVAWPDLSSQQPDLARAQANYLGSVVSGGIVVADEIFHKPYAYTGRKLQDYRIGYGFPQGTGSKTVQARAHTAAQLCSSMRKSFLHVTYMHVPIAAARGRNTVQAIAPPAVAACPRTWVGCS